MNRRRLTPGSYNLEVITFSTPKTTPSLQTMPTAVLGFSNKQEIRLFHRADARPTPALFRLKINGKPNYPLFSTALFAYSIWNTLPSGENCAADKSYLKENIFWELS